jgi:putative membrane protein
MSLYDPEKDEVAAFEELIGSHGELGGCQSRPFIMYPSNWNLGNEKIIGAEKVYHIFKNKISNTTLNKNTSK